MPFKSKAQMQKFAKMVKEGTMSEKTFKTWLAETPDPHKLPDRVNFKMKKHPKVKVVK